MGGLRRFILWDYRRASWQYDVMVGLILAFIFFTPRDFFRDQPKPASVVMLPVEAGRISYWIEPSSLEGVPLEDLATRATQMVNARFKTNTVIVRVEPILDEEEEVQGYVAFPAP
jgi:hypothetical protein